MITNCCEEECPICGHSLYLYESSGKGETDIFVYICLKCRNQDKSLLDYSIEK